MPEPPVSAAPGRVRLLAQFGLVYCAAIWGSTFFVVRDAVDHVHPVTLVGYRFTLAALLLLPFILARGHKPFEGLFARGGGPGIRLSPGLSLGLMLWLLYIAQTWGLTITTAANSGFITGLFIVFVPFVAWLIDRSPVQPMKLLAVAVAVGGLFLLSGGLSGLNSGDVLTLLAALTYAMHVLYTGRYAAEPHDPYVLTFQQVLVTGGLSLLTVAVSQGLHALNPELPAFSFSPGNASSIWAMLFLTVFPTLSAFLLQLICQRYVDPLRTALIFVLEPVFGAAFSWTIGGETCTLGRALGGLLIVAAMLLSELPLGGRGEQRIIDEHAPGS
ncbi:DMT family transporter [bacterium]|nr:DMT family transporter [bacterium]